MTGWSTVAFINLEINAITLSTPEMAESVRFWTVPGLEVTYGGPQDPFTTLALGANYINLFTVEPSESVAEQSGATFWGRVVLHVPSPDDMWQRYLDAGYEPMTEPADAPWGERYFHIRDPGGHEISFAIPLDS